MATNIPARSILKQPSDWTKKTSAGLDEQTSQAAKNKRNLNIALHHARKIQNQKDITAQILDSITRLLDLPTSDPFSQKDAFALTELLQPFQPSDFDSLIEERRVDGKCGYGLCAQPPRSQTLGESAAWKLKAGSADFCSTSCLRKALYLRTQLSEIPAWERETGTQIEILLHEDDRPAEDGNGDAGARRARRTARVEAWRQKVAGEEELARERGEQRGGFRPHEVMAEVVVEKMPSRTRAPAAPSVGQAEGDAFGLIEGFKPKPIKRLESRVVDDSGDLSDED